MFQIALVQIGGEKFRIDTYSTISQSSLNLQYSLSQNNFMDFKSIFPRIGFLTFSEFAKAKATAKRTKAAAAKYFNDILYGKYCKRISGSTLMSPYTILPPIDKNPVPGIDMSTGEDLSPFNRLSHLFCGRRRRRTRWIRTLQNSTNVFLLPLYLRVN
jgi:hypothetical protein